MSWKDYRCIYPFPNVEAENLRNKKWKFFCKSPNLMFYFRQRVLSTIHIQYCYTLIFYKQHFFYLASMLLNFSWIELQVLLSCCFIHISIIILRHILYLVYLCPCQGRVQFYVIFMGSNFRWGTHLYMSLFPSVRLSICLFVCLSVCPSFVCAPCLRNRTSCDHNFW